ncbi:MAG: hypothetical protein ACJAUD_000712 [Crocinitomicaceae bacterium]|jgi:hypothetical protein
MFINLGHNQIVHAINMTLVSNITGTQPFFSLRRIK